MKQICAKVSKILLFNDSYGINEEPIRIKMDRRWRRIAGDLIIGIIIDVEIELNSDFLRYRKEMKKLKKHIS